MGLTNWLRNRLRGPQRADVAPEPATVEPRRLNLAKVESARLNLPVGTTVPVWATTPAPGEDKALRAAPVWPVKKATPADAGCWLDEANHGWRIECAMISIAVERGWPITAEDQAVVDRYGSGEGTHDDGDYVREVADDALSWLSDEVAPEGYSFGWHEGNLLLGSMAQWCAWEGYQCYCTDPHDKEGNPLPATIGR